MGERGRIRRAALGYFVAAGILAHVAALGGFALGCLRYGPAGTVHKVASIAGSIAHSLPGTSASAPATAPASSFPDIASWHGRGASTEASSAVNESAVLRRVDVSDVKGLGEAIARASFGDLITLAPGTYRLEDKLSIGSNGLAQSPIVVRARRLGEVTLEIATAEGFLVRAHHWIFENLEVKGVCDSHDDCENAFHIVGGGDATRIHNCILRDFNAAIKANGTDGEGGRQFPDGVRIEGNSIYNTTVRNTESSVAPIDVLGVDGWVVRENFIADFAKGAGNRISYAAFFKGHSVNVLFERNLVVCEMRVLDPGAARIGLSFGGGGSTGSAACRDGTCVPEHSGGAMRNNVILHCNDAGIYLNRSADTQVLHNTLYDTYGIDVDFPESRVFVANNLLTGVVQERRGGKAEQSHNLVVEPDTFGRWFAEPGAADLRLENGDALVDRGDPLGRVDDDFCGALRDAAPDIGAIEYGTGRDCNPSSPRP